MNKLSKSVNPGLNGCGSQVLLSLLLVMTVACGDDGFDPKSVLSSYRVIALRADPPNISLTPSGATSSVLSLYDFHPAQLNGDRPKIEYEWRLCPFSLGSVTQYDCLLDELPLEGGELMMEEGESVDRPAANATINLNPLELFSALSEDLSSQMEQFEMGASMLGSEMNFFDSGLLEVYVKLTVKIEDEPDFELVKSMTVILDEEIIANENPEIDQVISDPLLDEDSALETESEISLEVSAVEGSQETYQALQSAEAIENGIAAEEKTETLLVSYYTTSGRFDQAVKLIDDTESTLTLGEEQGDQAIFVVLRDGRGGVDLRKYAFKVE